MKKLPQLKRQTVAAVMIPLILQKLKKFKQHLHQKWRKNM
jgi:hypothetical protein